MWLFHSSGLTNLELLVFVGRRNIAWKNCISMFYTALACTWALLTDPQVLSYTRTKIESSDVKTNLRHGPSRQEQLLTTVISSRPLTWLSSKRLLSDILSRIVDGHFPLGNHHTFPHNVNSLHNRTSTRMSSIPWKLSMSTQNIFGNRHQWRKTWIRHCSLTGHKIDACILREYLPIHLPLVKTTIWLAPTNVKSSVGTEIAHEDAR